ncbi:MAG: gamma-glutamyltransferase [Acidobacteriota bacterium]|nr:gamma-glutamyltransferase [Acidobacteriota bacterium]
MTSPRRTAYDQLAALQARGARANPYRAGRSRAMGRHGCVASSHPLATLAGLDCLRTGGTAMDAAITTAATLAVVEPMMTGIGGDAFFLHWDAATKELTGLNGSGRSPAALERDHFERAGIAEIATDSWEAVTVPGAVAAWHAGWEHFGSRPFAELLAPAIDHAEGGFPVGDVVGAAWRAYEDRLRPDRHARANYLAGDAAPGAGSIFRSPELGRSLRVVAEGGPEAFYRGPIAAEICRYSEETGGFLQPSDFAAHESRWVDPIQTTFRGHRIAQIPPNGQGLAVLLMLNLLETADLQGMGHSSIDYLHHLIEIKKIAYSDLHRWVADPEHANVPVQSLLSAEYAAGRRTLVDPQKAAHDTTPGSPNGHDTVYLSVVDEAGNAVSFINSLFDAFGSKIVGGDTGILLHNRGCGFTLQSGHPNEYGPGKRPFHTIIPGMVLRDDELYLSYGVMGGPFQPQGHLQFLLSHLEFGLSIQEAIDLPRWRHTEETTVLLEHGTSEKTMKGLENRGHDVLPAHGSAFGGAQAIQIGPDATRIGASDPRKDGCALAY